MGISFRNQYYFFMSPLHKKDINGLEFENYGTVSLTELPLFHGIKRYFKNSQNSP